MWCTGSVHAITPALLCPAPSDGLAACSAAQALQSYIGTEMIVGTYWAVLSTEGYTVSWQGSLASGLGGHPIPLGWGTLNPSGLGDTQSLTPSLDAAAPAPHCPSPQLQARAHPIPARLASHLTPHPTTIPACRTLNARTAVTVFRRVSQP